MIIFPSVLWLYIGLLHYLLLAEGYGIFVNGKMHVKAEVFAVGLKLDLCFYKAATNLLNYSTASINTFSNSKR
jgi:hypothetical protein